MILAFAASVALSISGGDEARLTKGEIVLNVLRDEGEDSGQVDAWIDIPAAPALVWQTLNDCAGAPRFVPSLLQCKVVESDPLGAWDIREHLADPGWLLPNIRSRFRADYTPQTEIRFVQIEGDFEVMQGRWTLAPIDAGQGTRLRYEARLKPKMWVPDFIVRGIIEHDAPDTLRALRTEAVRRKTAN